MQSFSAAAKSLLQGGAKLSVSIAVNALSGALTITDEDIIRDSFVIDRNSVSGQTIEIGNVESTELSFLLENADRGFDAVWFEGAELTVTLTAGAESWVAGIFTVDKPPQGIDTIGIAALDHMARFDQPYSTSLTGKQTLLAILQDSCNTCGVTLGTTSFTNDSYLAIVPVDAQISHRQVLAWVAQLAGANAWIDHTGALRLSWYGENQGTTEIEVTQDDYNIDGYALAENDVSLSGLVWRTADADYLWGSDEYALAIEGNSLIDPDNYDAALTAVYNKIDGFFYRPYTVDAIPMPWVWPLDMIQLTTITGAVIPSIVTGNRIMLGDGSRLNGVGETATVTGYASYAPFTPSQQSVIQKTTRDVMRVFGIDAGWITVGILDADRIAAESINAFHLAADAVTTEKLAAGAVTAEEIAAGTITAGSAIIADGAITSAKIGDAQITTAKIEAGAITTALIDEAAIGTTQIADGSITDAKIVELTANKITSGQLTTDRLIIRDPLNPENSLIYEINNITGALQAIQGETLNGEVLTERTITADKIVANAITAAEIAAETITANEMAVGTITAASGIIADAAITTAKIADASITDAKISSLSADKITAGTIDANEVSIINLDVQTVTIGSETDFEAGYDPTEKAEKSTAVSISGKSATIKLNTTDGLAFFDGASYRGGLAVRGGDLTLLTDIIGTPDDLYHYAQFDQHDPYMSGDPDEYMSILRFFSKVPSSASSDNFLDISGRINGSNSAQAYLSNVNNEATVDITAGGAPYETPIGSSWIQLNRSNSAKKAHIWLHAINDYQEDATIRLWSQSSPYIEFMTDMTERGRFDSSGLKVNGSIFEGGTSLSVKYDHRRYNDQNNYLGTGYNSGGGERPNWFGAGKLKAQMLSYSNLGGGGGSWNDVLWISTYTGGDVKASNALIMGKTSEFIGFARQNYDATSWGPVRTILHSGNYTSYAAAASHNHSTLNSGTWTRSQTSHGYIDFGPANTGAAHIYTDRAQFYYNKGATMVGDLTLNGPSYGAREIITTSNCNLILKPSGKYSLGLGYDGTISLLVDHPASGKFFVMDAMGTGSQGGEPTLRPSHTGGWGYIGADSYYKFYRGYCSSWVNSSSLEFKENLRPFDCDEAYDLIKNMPVYAYRHKDKEDIQLGVLVEDSPLEVLNVDSYGADQKSIDVYSFTAMTLAAVQKMQQKIEQLEMELASMKEVA